MIRRLIVVLSLVLSLSSVVFGAVVLLNRAGVNPSHWSGLSTDTKPSTGNIGSTFYVEDTGVLFMYGSSGWVVDNRNLGGER